MGEEHFIVDVGPGLQVVLLSLIAAIPGSLAAYFAYMSKRAIDQANSHLAIALNLHSNPAGESKLTVSPIHPPTQPKE